MPPMKKTAKESVMPTIKKQIVSCPLMSQFDTLVETTYCINKCEFYSRLVDDSSGKTYGAIECNYPRRIKVYPMAE